MEDFGWIKAVQSPNWRVLDEAEREQTLPVDSGVLAEAQRLVDSQEDDEI